jgi:hypothetical protein
MYKNDDITCSPDKANKNWSMGVFFSESASSTCYNVIEKEEKNINLQKNVVSSEEMMFVSISDHESQKQNDLHMCC